MAFIVLTVLSVLAGVVTVILWPALKLHHDAREPPLVKPAIPVFGHIVNLVRYSNVYYTRLRKQYPSLGCYTLNLYSSKAYVVQSPELVAAVQRNPKVFTFDPIVLETAQAFTGMSKEGLAKIRVNDVCARTLKNMHPQMLPGPGLDAMNRSMVADVADSVNKLVRSQHTEIDLYRWVRETIGVASSNAVWGAKHNPFANLDILRAFETYEQNLMPLLLGFAPNIVAREGCQSREIVVHALLDYVRKGGFNYASSMIEERRKINQDELAMSDEDLVRAEVSMALGVLGNIIPTSFWMLFHVYSNLELLKSLRAELVPLVIANDAGTARKYTLDVSSLRTSAPRLLSYFQEVVRARSTGASVRFVEQDTVLADKYLLKKGNIIQMPSAVLHLNPSSWGTSANQLKAERFVPFQAGEERINPVSYRGFGGGDHICPGRFFAAAESISMVAIMVLAFDMETISHNWIEPPLNAAMFSSSILPPKGNIPVLLKRRKDFADGDWELTLSESKGRFKLASG